MINPNEHVYCTDCINYECTIRCVKHLEESCGNCSCLKCDCYDTEDSRPFSERPNYVSIN
jgi:hypothetical protein